MKKLVAFLAFSLFATMASANVVTFNGGPSKTFAAGTFSTGLSGRYNDGFFQSGSNTSAYNGYGQDGEFVLFNSPVQLNSLFLKQDSFSATSVIVSLYDTLNTLIAQQSLTLSANYQSLTFNTNNVSKAVFNTTGRHDAYGDGRRSAWYMVDNITYSANQANVPEPTSIALFGLGLLGFAASRRKSASAENT